MTTPRYDKIKHKSNVFLDMKKHVEDLLQNTEITEKAIKDRNIIIKSLKADIEHRKIAFKEIEGRYEDINLKINEKTRLAEQLLEELNNLKKEYEKNKTEYFNLKQKIEEQNKQLEETKIHLAFIKKEKDNNLASKIEKIGEKLPSWPLKLLFKIISSPTVLNCLILAIFCLLFIASFTGWGFIADTIKPFTSLFK